MINPVSSFIHEMGYLQNEKVLGAVLCGSYSTRFQQQDSDIDLHVILDDSCRQLIRGTKQANGHRIEYFEKPISDLYTQADTDFKKQANHLLAIIGKGKILFDRDGSIKNLQDYVLQKYSQPLPPLSTEDAREEVATITNRIKDVKNALRNGKPEFEHIYHLTVDKIRDFYHRMKGLPAIPYAKVHRLYTEKEYREFHAKEPMPEEEFIAKYLAAIFHKGTSIDKIAALGDLFEYSTQGVSLDPLGHRIMIKTRNTQIIENEPVKRKTLILPGQHQRLDPSLIILDTV